ncbi:acetate--CoA ligase family protein [Agrobacterium sp. T29]|uniref:acetate--CoA ligase family protein n=1 Tax=Agrobacterium sp. T29 TaxID=2580515 RepID=UPI00115F012F|nr:acetate--CoA ligase family protein [Agrobacterium sp. T29]
MTLRTTFDRIFNPASVAVIGASDDRQRLSGRPLHYMLSAGYKGDIFAVHPKREVVQGLKAYRSLADVPTNPDMALICVSAERTLAALEECALRGVAGAVVFASGFAEVGDEGMRAQAEIARISGESGMRIFGPNCLGVFNSASGFIGTFASTFDEGPIEDGQVAVISQSGAYGAHLAHMCRSRGVGIRYWASTGNEVDVDVATCIGWMAEREDVSVIMVYAEGIRDGQALIRSLEMARRNRKAVVFFKAGESEAGSAAAMSHTAALAGEERVIDAIFAEFGVCRVYSAEEHVDVAYACTRQKFPKGRKVALVSLSGGFGIQMADAAERNKLDVKPTSPELRHKLSELAPFGSMVNPCDVTAGALNNLDTLSKTFSLLYEEGGYDAIVGHFTMLPSSPTFGDALMAAIDDGTRAHRDRPTVLCMLASKETVKRYEDMGFLVFNDTARAMSALSALARLREGFDAAPAEAMPVIEAVAVNVASPLSELASLGILKAAGIPFLPTTLVQSAEEAVLAWSSSGSTPVVMKIVSPDILHKTEIGGVILGVDGEEAVRSAFVTLKDRAARAAPDARIEGIMVVPMAPRGVEVIAGIKRDPAFGPMVMFGLGGTMAELFEDVSIRRAPFGTEEAKRMIGATRCAQLLHGFRGGDPADIEALAMLLSRLSIFAEATRDTVDSVDINPVLVLKAGSGVFALDAVVIASPITENSSKRHDHE